MMKTWKFTPPEVKLDLLNDISECLSESKSVSKEQGSRIQKTNIQTVKLEKIKIECPKYNKKEKFHYNSKFI